MQESNSVQDSLGIVQLETLNQFREKLAKTRCNNCGMHDLVHAKFQTPVVSTGNGRIMFIGASVTPDEHKASKPFTGTGGTQATRLIATELMLDVTSKCYMTNLIKCRGDMDVKPKPADKRECGRYLLREFALVDPVITVFLGTDQAKIMLGKQPFKLGSLGQYVIAGKKRWVYIMNNIAGIIASSSYDTEVRRQLRNLRSWLNEHTDIYSANNIDIPDQDLYERKYVLVDSMDKLRAMVNDLKDKKLIAVDTETNSLNVWWKDFNTVGFCLAGDSKTGYYVPVGHKLDPKTLGASLPVNVPKDITIKALTAIFGKKDKSVGFYNVAYDYRVLQVYGLQDLFFYHNEQGKPMWHDAMILWYLLDENISDKGAANRMARSLKQGTRVFLNREPLTFKETIGDKDNFELVPPKKALQYAADDALNTWELIKLLYPRVHKESDGRTQGVLLNTIYVDEVETAIAFADAHMRGMGLDAEYRAILRQTLLMDAKELNASIAKISGPVSVTGVKDLTAILMNVIDPSHVDDKDHRNAFLTRFEKQYDAFHFDKTQTKNFIRFYKERWDDQKNGFAAPGKWTPTQLSEWMTLVTRARKVAKYRSTYVDGISATTEEIEHDVDVEVDGDGKITKIHTPGWKLNRKGEVVPE